MTAVLSAVDAKRVIASKKQVMMSALDAYSKVQKSSAEKRRPALMAYQQAATEYFNCAEELVGDSDVLGARESADWAQGYAENCKAVLETMPDHYQVLRLEFGRLGMPSEIYEPSSTAFANMQRMVVSYIKKKEVDKLRRTFELNRLPVYGFEYKSKDFMKTNLVWSFVFGVVFIIVMLTIALLKPDPSAFQFKVFHTVLSLAGAGIGAMLPGFLEVKMKKYLRAGGAFAIFAIVYFNPALLT